MTAIKDSGTPDAGAGREAGTPPLRGAAGAGRAAARGGMPVDGGRRGP